jgi:hypothetical protein
MVSQAVRVLRRAAMPKEYRPERAFLYGDPIADEYNQCRGLILGTVASSPGRWPRRGLQADDGLCVRTIHWLENSKPTRPYAAFHRSLFPPLTPIPTPTLLPLAIFMSDNEGPTKKSGYRLEYAASARAKCKGMYLTLQLRLLMS